MKSLSQIIIIVLIVAGGLFLYTQFFNKKGIEPNQPIHEVQEAVIPETKTDQALKVGEAIYDVTKDLVKEKKRSDDLRRANREQVWVYKIGLEINDEKEVAETLKKLEKVNNIYVFKKSKNKYFIYKDDGYSSAIPEDSVQNLKLKLGITENRIKSVNLMSLCRKNETLVKTTFKVRRKFELTCYECN